MVRRREEVVDGRHAPSVLGRERTQVEALRRERDDRIKFFSSRFRIGEALDVEHEDAGPVRKPTSESRYPPRHRADAGAPEF